MNRDLPLEQLVESVAEACERLADDFEQVRASYLAANPDWTSAELAAHLMDLGRAQISGVEQCAAADLDLLSRHMGAVAVPGQKARQFCAFATGCLMGWVANGELSEEQLTDALHVVKYASIRIFPEQP
jgi:hypothetical protein